VKAFVQPSAAAVSAFTSFTSGNNISTTVTSPNGDWVSITLAVSKANDLFAAQFEVFSHPDMAGTITRTLSLSLPSELVGHVDVVRPTTEFVPPIRLASTTQLVGPTLPESCNSTDPAGFIVPSCLQELYGIPTTPATESNNALLVTGYSSQWPQVADLQV
jgi:tripeptidyl-peptidase-1